MKPEPPNSLTFSEPGSGEECWIGLRLHDGLVILGLSRASDGDVEISLDQEALRWLTAALADASATLANASAATGRQASKQKPATLNDP